MWKSRDRTPTVRPYHRHTNVNNSINRYGNPNATRAYFDRKSHSHPRLVKQRQLKSQWTRKRKAEILSICIRVFLSIKLGLIVNSNATRCYFDEKSYSHQRLVKQRQLKIQWTRKRKAGILSVSVFSRARDKRTQETFFCWKNNLFLLAAVRKWEMLAATNARWTWVEVKKKSEQGNVRQFSPWNV